jgi:tetratricopeptide (TPR) repeat protein
LLEEQALEASRRLLGGEHPDMLTAMNNLAQKVYAQGDLGPARALFAEAVEASRRLHPATLRAISNLALTVYAQGDLGAAQSLQEQALEVYRGLLGRRAPGHADDDK